MPILSKSCLEVESFFKYLILMGCGECGKLDFLGCDLVGVQGGILVSL